MAKYLVTGIAGFIASRTAELLLDEGHDVIGIDNLNDYYDIRLKIFRLHRVAINAGPDMQSFEKFDYLKDSPTEYRDQVVLKQVSSSFTKLR